MKYITNIFIIALTANISFGFNGKEIQKSSLDGKLKSFLERLKPILQTGDETLGIPILDPFTTEYQKINFSEDKFNIVGDLRVVKVDGLSDYNINNALFKLAGLKITLNITWPSIQYKSSYNLDHAKFDNWEGFGLFGDGDVTMHVTNFTFGATAQLDIKSNKVFVKKLSTGLSLEAIKFVASGIYNNEEASESINAIVSSSSPYVLETYQWLIVGEINVRLKNLINSYLLDVTLQDITNIISH